MTREEKLAQSIDVIKVILMAHEFDSEYALECARQLADQATRQESMAVLNPMHVPSKNELLRKQAETLSHLALFHKGLIECEQLKQEVKSDLQTQHRINKLFI